MERWGARGEAVYARVIRCLRTAAPAHLNRHCWPVTFAIPRVVKLTYIAVRQRTDILPALQRLAS